MPRSNIRRRAFALSALIIALSAIACEKPEGKEDEDDAKPAAQTKKEPEFIKAASGPVRPFSPAVRANGFLILSGQIATDSTGKLITGGIQEQTKQTMENIKAELTRNGSSMDRVVKCTVFMGDMKEWAAMNDVYVTFFNEARRPARSAMGASGLALGAKVEIECLAAE